jgi:beta-glucanase (GH16 family)
LVFADEFDGTEVDETKWNVLDCPNGINNDIAYMAPHNVWVEDGHLVLRQQREEYEGYQYTAGKVNTQHKFTFRYGRIEIRARPPAGNGLHSALWTATEGCSGTATGNVNCIWPPEIDIVEILGERPDTYYTYYHAGQGDTNGGGGWHYPGCDLAEDFHVYAVEWDPGEIRWYLDGVLYQTLTQADADVAEAGLYNHILILDTTVGGNWPVPPDDTTPFPSIHRIDHVRVYQWKGPPRPTSTPAPTHTPTIVNKELVRDEWTASASGSADGHPPEQAIDGSADTCWTSAEGQAPDRWFQLDLGATRLFNRLEFDGGGEPGSGPGDYEVVVSRDGETWGAPIAGGEGSEGETIIPFETQMARYVRIVQTDSGTDGHWSVCDLRVYIDLSEDT